ncbi:MAG: MBL fold metallo-hydrolase [Verrucomicrobiota bacterium JB023]|nr:MBL fold metallo-hydrolase [Verrucomicrobiota bacterium JB023]
MSESAVQFQSLCRAPEIGANSYLMTFGGTRLVIDAGMHPKQLGTDSLPRYDELPYDSIDTIFVSHAHLDHLGTLPVLQRQQPRAKVYMTPEVVELAEALLHNSVNVMTNQRIELDIDSYPLFTHREIDEFSQVWQGLKYNKTIEPFWDRELNVSFRDAGHVLGSAGILLEGEGKRVFYTGDVQFEDQTLIKGAQFNNLPALDALIVETTRGNHAGKPGFTRQAEEQRLIANLNETLDRNGAALVPVFAMGKTQEVITMIQNAKESGDLPDVPVVIGGLSTKMTVIYDHFSGNANRRREDFKILRDAYSLQAGTRRRKGRAPIKYQPRAIFALSSGMMSENTVSNNFARSFLDDPINSVHFVGYSDPSTPAYQVRNASRGDKVVLDERWDPVELQADVHEYDFSGHASRESILDFILTNRPPKVFLVHGDPAASLWFQEQLKTLAPEIETIIPEPGQSYGI